MVKSTDREDSTILFGDEVDDGFSSLWSSQSLYVRELSFSDYYGAKVTGQGAIQKIRDAWESERSAFSINKKANTLIYSYPENGNIYELKYIYEDVPPELNAVLLPKSIKMDLKEALK